VAGTCGYGEELSGSINAENFLTSCKVYWLASQEGLCSMELNDLYSLPNTVRVVKSRRMRWAGHVARMGEDNGVRRVLVGKS
jgi:hypothetical protein